MSITSAGISIHTINGALDESIDSVYTKKRNNTSSTEIHSEKNPMIDSNIFAFPDDGETSNSRTGSSSNSPQRQQNLSSTRSPVNPSNKSHLKSHFVTTEVYFYDLLEVNIDEDASCTCCTYCCSSYFRNRKYAWIATLFGFMLTCIFLAVITEPVVNVLINAGIYEAVVIDSVHASGYDDWQSSDSSDDISVGYNIMYFDIQNPEEILKGEKPYVSQVGPYSYDEHFNKFDISFSDDGDTVTYNQQKYYTFNKENSDPGVSESDLITLPYTSSIAFTYLIDSVSPHTVAILDSLVTSKLDTSYEGLKIMTGQITRDAIAKRTRLPSQTNIEIDLLLAKIRNLNTSIDGFYDRMYTFTNESNPLDLILKVLLYNTSSGVSPFWKTTPGNAWFGWFNDPVFVEIGNILKGIDPTILWATSVLGTTYNYTSIDDARRRRNVDVQKTGKKNVKEIGQYVAYQNMTELYTCINPVSNPNDTYNPNSEFPSCAFFQYDWNETEIEKYGYTAAWPTPYAMRIRGSNAEQFGTPIESELMQVFVSDIYRSVYLEKIGTEDWHKMPLQKYSIQDKDIYNATQNPQNAQYNSFGPTGLLNLTQATTIPVFASYPHFMHGDDSLVEAVGGLSPDPSIHSSYLSMEPRTGLLLDASKKLQSNYYISAKSFPTAKNDSIEYAHSICASLQDTIDNLNRINATNGTNTTLPNITCTLTTLDPLLECLMLNADWDIKNGGIYFPLGWVSEELSVSDHVGRELYNSVYGTEDVGRQIRFWCLIVSACCFFMIIALVATEWCESKDLLGPLSRVTKKARSGSRMGVDMFKEPLIGTNNGNHKGNVRKVDYDGPESFSFAA